MSAGPEGALTRRLDKKRERLLEDAQTLLSDVRRLVAELEKTGSVLGTRQIVQSAEELDRDARYLTGLSDGLDLLEGRA